MIVHESLFEPMENAISQLGFNLLRSVQGETLPEV